VLGLFDSKTHMGRNMHIEKLKQNVPSWNTFWSWVEQSFSSDYKKEIEHFLNESTDLKDLEYKINVLKRRGLI
jgi:hypothetical protein